MNNFKKLPILLYDSNCTLCCRFQKALDLIDVHKTVNSISLHETSIYEYYPEVNYEECQRILHLIDEDRNVLVGGKAIEYLIQFLPGIKKFSWLIENEKSKHAIDLFYDRVNQFKKGQKSCRSCE